MPRLNRKQIIAIILKKKSLLSGLFQGKTPAMGIHRVLSETKMRRFLSAYMKTSPVELVVTNPQRGMFPSWVVTLKGGQKAVFKSDFAAQEHLAHVVDRVMGFNKVPVVVPRTITVGEAEVRSGILMQW